MKRALVFLLLLAVGIGLLRWFQGPGKAGLGERASEPQEDWTQSDETPTSGLTPRGAVEFKSFSVADDAGAIATNVELRSTGSGPEPGGEHLFLTGVELSFFDPATGTLRSRIHAARARVRQTGTGADFVPELGKRVELEDVAAEIFEGAPVVPLTVRVATLAVEMDERTLSSSDAVTLEGEELSGSGLGLFVDEARSLLRIERAAVVRLRSQAGDAVLRSGGPLEIVRGTEADPEEIVITAGGGARLAPAESEGGAEDGLDAADIVLRGSTDDAGYFRLASLDARGGAVYRLGGDELRGEEAHVELDAFGKPASTHLDGEPHARIALARAASWLPGQTPPEDAGELDVSSEAPMDLRWEEGGVRLETAGPAKAVGAGAELTAQGRVEAVSEEGGARTRFSFHGGVRLEREGVVLVTDELETTLERDEEGKPVLRATAKGRPLLTGSRGAEQDFLLSADEVLKFEQRGDSWSIPEALGVQLNVLGTGAFRAQADEVRDFDPAGPSFSARGNIQIEGAEGTGSGDELDVESRELFTLRGTPAEKAVFDSPDGHAEAGVVIRDGNRILLRNAVVARFTPSARGGEVYDLACDELSVTRSLPGPIPPAAPRADQSFDLEAHGAIKGRVERPEDTLELACAHLFAHHEEALAPDGSLASRESALTCDGVQRAFVERAANDVRVQLKCERLSATRVETAVPDAEPVIAGEAVASGAVEFHGFFGPSPFQGTADELRIDQAGKASILAHGDHVVSLAGTLPSTGRPFAMSARWIEASADRVEASHPDINVTSIEEGSGGSSDFDVHARAEHMESTDSWLEFRGDVVCDGVTETAIPWQLNADLVRFEGRVGVDVERADVAALMASGNVVLSLPGRGTRATGDLVRAVTLSGLMRLEGNPARIESQRLIHEAEWIELDVNLGFVVGSGRGSVRPAPGAISEPTQRQSPDASQDEMRMQTAPEDEWSIRYLSSRTLVEPDAFVYVLQEPVVHYTGDALTRLLPVEPARDITISASWAVFWVDRKAWAELPDRLDSGAPPSEQPAPQAPAPDGVAQAPAPEPSDGFFERVRGFGVLNEVYLEGPVEVRLDEHPGALASAAYLDVVSGHGWLADVSFSIHGAQVGRDFKRAQVKARWLRQSEGLSFHADEATVALCEFDDPHVQITTGDFQINPLPDGRYNIQLKENRVELYDRLSIPLPSIDYTSSEESLKPDWASFQIGDSARFGSFVSAGVVRPANKLGGAVHGLVGRSSKKEVDAEYSVDTSWLGSRGVLLDLGATVRAESDYWWIVQLGGVPDSNDDKGYIRVPEDDRDTLRLWFRTHGRYLLEEDEWIDLVSGVQTDAGVQSEFFESEFEDYEQSETYVRWRKAEGDGYYSATAKVPANDFFTDIDELPSAGAWRGRAEVVPLGPTALLYAANASAAYLQRHESDGGYASPFGLPAVFDDGLGDREVLRFDTTHKLEVPVDLGAAGLRATPYVLGRFTAWDRDVTQDESPSRALAEAGMRVATTFWQRSGGDLYQLVPYVEASADLALEESGGTPVEFDAVEDPVQGDVVKVGLRTRIAQARADNTLDLDVRAQHASDAPEGVSEGWSELGVFSRLTVTPFDYPVQVGLDGRYDLELERTLYSQLVAGFRPTDTLALQAGHSRGLDLDHEVLFEAASVAALYTWTPKWEFEGRQTISLLNDDSLGYRVMLRRYGHDFVFEIESSFRRGEGYSIGLSLRPLLGWNRPDIGTLGF